MVTESDIDHLVQVWGHRLGTEHSQTREEARRALERQEIRQKEWNELPVPIMTMPKSF